VKLQLNSILKIAVSWVVAWCSVIEVYRRFTGAFRPEDSHLHTAVRTSDFTKQHNVSTYVRTDVKLHAFLTSTLSGGQFLSSCSGRSTIDVYWKVEWVGPRAGLDIQVRIQVLKATTVTVIIFWYIAECRLVKTDYRFGAAYCLLHQGSRPETSITFCQTTLYNVSQTANFRKNHSSCISKVTASWT
jgi:hypothetical protein